MKKLIYLLYVCTLAITCKAQDTITFISKERKAVKVTEVGLTEIKYNRWDNQTGPQYVASKNDITSIKYYNGHIDTFKVATVEIVAIVAQPNTTTTDYYVVNTNTNDKIEIRGSRLSYHGRGLNDNMLFTLIDNVPNKVLRKDLIMEYAKMKNFQRNQYISGFGGLGLAIVSVVGGMAIAINDPYGNGSQALLGLTGGVVFGVGGIVTSTIYKSLRLKSRKEIAKRYNDFN